MSAISYSGIDDEKDSRFGAYGYECLALWQHRDEYIGYIWVPDAHVIRYLPDDRTRIDVCMVNYLDMRLGACTITLRLGPGYERWPDRVACMIALMDAADKLRRLADAAVHRHPGGARDTWQEPDKNCDQQSCGVTDSQPA